MTTPYPNNPLPWHASPHDFTGDNNLGPYAEETTQRYIPGTRFTTWDGRVFKYARSITAWDSSLGVFNNDVVVNIGVSGTQAVVAGDRIHNLTLDADSGYAGAGVAENELVGAYITTGHGESNEQVRCIMGNTLAAASAVTTLILDYPWDTTLTDTTAWTEIMLNPYNYTNTKLGGSSAGLLACVGVAPSNVGALAYSWLQSYGPMYMTSSAGAGNAGNQRDCYVVEDGTVRDGSEITIENGYQRIGYIIDTSSGAGGCMPMVMLQISI
jgi:hypothetical protein